MQFLLTEQEYNDLFDEIKKEKDKSREIIQKLCVMVAENKPVLFWNRKTPNIWGCCQYGSEEIENYGYCDECPVQKYCPSGKIWSK